MGLHGCAPSSALRTVLTAALITAIATLTIAVSGTGTARAAGPCTDSWKAPVNGDWSEPAKWSTGSVPSTSAEVCITVAGTYTVTAESSSSSLEVKSLTVGPESGSATLSLRGLGCTTSTNFRATANITTTALGTIQLTNAAGSCSEGEDVDLNWGGTFANAGKITVAAGTAGGTRELDGALTNTGKISIGVSTSSNSTLENKGSITVANEAILSSSSSTVTNGTGGSVTDTGTGALEVDSGTVNQGAGAAGKVYVFDSTLNLLGAGAGTFALEGSDSLTGNISAAQSVVVQGDGCYSGSYVTAAAGFTNAGSIELTNVEAVCAESQPARLEWSGTLTNTGKITSNFGAAGGSRALNGNLTNSGTVNIESETSFGGSGALFTNKKTVTVTDEALFFTTGGQTFTDATDGSVTTASGGSLGFDDTTFNVGPGSPGSAPVLLENSSKLNLTGATAAGTFIFRGSDTMTGSVAAGQSVVLQSVGCVSGAEVTAPAAFTNAGSIELTNVEGVCAESEPAALRWSGTLTNTGTLASNFGSAGGSRALNGSLTNSGAVNIDSDTSLEGSGAVFTNKNAVTVADEALFFTTGGQTFTEATGGSVTTASGGSLGFDDTTFNVGPGSPGSAPVLLENSSKLNLTGATAAGTFVFRGSDTMTGSVAAGQSVVLQSVGCVSGAYVTASAGFTNAGSIELTNVKGTCADSQPAQLEWSGTLTNTGTLTSAFGSAGGSRTLNGNLTNKGTVNIKSATAFDGSGALFDNKGAVALTNGATLSTDGGQTFDNDTGGSISTASGSLSFQNTIFDVGAGSPGSAPVLLANSSTLNLNGSAAGTFAFRGDGTLNVPTGTVAAGQSVVLQSVGCLTGTFVSAPAGFTNAGLIELTNVKGTCADSQPAQLEWSGTVTNTGTITSAVGSAGGTRTLSGNLINSHAVNIDASTSLGSGAQLTNSGTLTLAAGKTLSLQSATFTQESGGDLVENIAGASSFGKLHNPGGSDSLGGTLTLDTASGYTPPHATKFLFMTFGSETGKFAPNVFNGHNYSVKYDPADVTLSALDNTTTAVGLSSDSTQVGNAVTVTAKVTGPEAPGNPTGKITFSSNGSGAFTPATTCTLAATATPGVSECSATYTPSAVGTGTHTISASYPGDGNYVKSLGSSPLTVTTRTTTTTVECNPASVATGVASTCTATVTDTNAGTVSTPTGTVGFSSNGAGSFSATSCTLAAGATAGTASCSVTYTPSATGTQTITGAYGGDTTHASSTNGTALTVT
jgi:hypothetical protein